MKEVELISASEKRFNWQSVQDFRQDICWNILPRGHWTMDICMLIMCFCMNV